MTPTRHRVAGLLLARANIPSVEDIYAIASIAFGSKQFQVCQLDESLFGGFLLRHALDSTDTDGHRAMRRADDNAFVRGVESFNEQVSGNICLGNHVAPFISFN